jgi:hypothetical protein
MNDELMEPWLSGAEKGLRTNVQDPGFFLLFDCHRGILATGLRSWQGAVRSACQQLESTCTRRCIPDGMYLTKANENPHRWKMFRQTRDIVLSQIVRRPRTDIARVRS